MANQVDEKLHEDGIRAEHHEERAIFEAAIGEDRALSVR
jgi:hypothetical protein